MIKPEILNSWGPGGWIFYQPESDWWAPLPLANNFQAQVKNIIAHRKANPRFNLPVDEAAVAAELEAFTEARWRKTYSQRGMQKFLHETPEDKKKDWSAIRSSSSTGRAVAGRAGGVVRAAVGLGGKALGLDTRGLEEWLGHGGIAVARELAEKRAAVCASCPANQSGWREMLTVPAANKIALYLEQKHQLHLATSHDEKLEECSVCHCVLTLKVWQPLEFALTSETEETLEERVKANPGCWIVKEMLSDLSKSLLEKV